MKIDTKLCAWHRIVALALGASGCLPIDDRPPPGSALLTVSGDDVASGLTTDDGWAIHYERVLMTLGNFYLLAPIGVETDTGCAVYSEGHYFRIVDLLQPDSQKLVLLHALGDCEFIFQVGDPREGARRQEHGVTVLGPGVSEADETFMRTPGSDHYVEDQAIGFHVAGIAERSGTSIRFAWSFRDSIDYVQCVELHFEGNASTTVDIRVRTAALFDDPDDTNDPPSRFDPFASADANGDGTLLLEELETVTLPNDLDYPTLGARLYRKIAPELPFVPDALPCIPVFTGK